MISGAWNKEFLGSMKKERKSEMESDMEQQKRQ